MGSSGRYRADDACEDSRVLMATGECEDLIRSLMARVQHCSFVELAATERAEVIALLRHSAVDFGCLVHLAGCVARVREPNKREIMELLELPRTSIAQVIDLLSAEVPSLKILSYEELLAVVEHGFELLTDDALARIVTSPVAALQIFDAVSETLPDLWLDEMNTIGNAILAVPERSSLQFGESKNGVGASRGSTLVRAGANYGLKYQAGFTLLSCAASLASLVACLYLVREGSRGSGQAAHAVRSEALEQAVRWELQASEHESARFLQLWTLYDPADYALSVSDMERAADPAVKKLIMQLRQRRLGDKEILAVIRAKVSDEEYTSALWAKFHEGIDQEMVSRLQSKGLSKREILAFAELFSGQD